MPTVAHTAHTCLFIAAWTHRRYRTQQTCSPLAESLSLPIDNRLGFMPHLCGLLMDCDSVETFMDHKIRKYPAVEASIGASAENWLKTISDCSDYTESQQCHPDGTCTAGLQQPGLGGADGGVVSMDNPTCTPYGWGAHDKLAGTCCNSLAAQVIKGKLMEPGVDTILVCWCARQPDTPLRLATDRPRPPSTPLCTHVGSTPTYSGWHTNSAGVSRRSTTRSSTAV